MKIKTGNTDSAKTVKAGCGMRYDPEQLGDHTGFDFSGAEQWKTQLGETLEAHEPKEDKSAAEDYLK